MNTTYCKISLKPLNKNEAEPGYKSTALKSLFDNAAVSPHLPFSRSEFFQSSRQYSQGMSISGVQQKLSLKENAQRQLEPTSEGGEYILKPSPEAYPHAAENEHTAMQLGKLLGINTAQCGLVDFAGGEFAYLTRRFDRTKGSGKLHQEDLMQCFNLPGENKYSKTYEEAGKLIHQVTGGKQAPVLDFVRRVIFAYLIGNDDLHLKNISVQRLPNNTSLYYDKLSPNYDCLFCDAFNVEGSTSELGQLALGLLLDPDDGDEAFTAAHDLYGYYTGYDFLELGMRLNLPSKPVQKFLDSLQVKESEIFELIQRSYMPKLMKNRALSLTKDRLKALGIIFLKS